MKIWNEDAYYAMLTAYDGEGEGEGEGSEGEGGEAAAAATKKVFYEDDVNRIVQERLARDRKAYETQRKEQEARNKELENQYNSLLENHNLSSEDREKLEGQLEDLQKQSRSKEENAKIELKKQEEKYQNELKEASQRATQWEEKYRSSEISRALMDAASAEEAWDDNQIVQLLKGQTKLVEAIGEDGKSTGKLVPMVDFEDTDEEGKPVLTQRTPIETVKRMKEIERYANLFKSNVVSGVGSNSATGGIAPGSGGKFGASDLKNMTPEQYMKARKENPAALGLKSVRRI